MLVALVVPSISCTLITSSRINSRYCPMRAQNAFNVKRKDSISGKFLDGEKDNWKPDITVVKATVQFLQETARLTYRPEEGQVG
jgi:hypothetical protein